MRRLQGEVERVGSWSINGLVYLVLFEGPRQSDIASEEKLKQYAFDHLEGALGFRGCDVFHPDRTR
jgi:hypothetical protein